MAAKAAKNRSKQMKETGRIGQVNFRMDPKEKRAFSAQARREGLSLSAWLRHLAYERIEKKQGKAA